MLSAYYITSFIVESMMFKPIRDFIKSFGSFFDELFSCMFCMGFWVGVLHSLLLQIDSPFAFSICACGLAGSTWIIHSISEKLNT